MTPAERAELRRLHAEVNRYTTGGDAFFKAAVNALPSLLDALNAAEARLLMHPNGECNCGGEGRCQWCLLSRIAQECEDAEVPTSVGIVSTKLDVADRVSALVVMRDEWQEQAHQAVRRAEAAEAKLAEERAAHAETMARTARMVDEERTQADNARALADQLGARCVDLAERLATAEHFRPTPANINALPMPLRQHIHDLETRCDPAGDVQTMAALRENVEALVLKLAEAEKDYAGMQKTAADMHELLTTAEAQVGAMREALDEFERGAVKRGENEGVRFEAWRGQPSYWIDRLRAALSTTPARGKWLTEEEVKIIRAVLRHAPSCPGICTAECSCGRDAAVDLLDGKDGGR